MARRRFIWVMTCPASARSAVAWGSVRPVGRGSRSITQRLPTLAAGRLKRGPGVEAQMGRAGDERIVARPPVQRQVRDDEEIGLGQGVRAD